MSKTSIEIYETEMSDEMQREVLQVALLAVNMYTSGYDIARYIVKEFDKKHGNYWHCVVGNVSYYGTFQGNNYICFSVGGKGITLFKSAQ